MSIEKPIRIGTRASRLALAQTEEACQRLRETHPQLAAEGAIEIVEIRTTGDKVQDRALAEIGGKGLFSKEIDAAMRDGRIDVAVHSAKDLETALGDGIALACTLPREDARDAYIARAGGGLDELPDGAVVGTSSLRRQAQILHRRPDLEVRLFRGNVQTRLRKLEAGEVEMTLLAVAGLNRLGMLDVATRIAEPDELLPACGQGTIALTCREGDSGLAEMLAAIGHEASAVRLAAERAMLAALDGSCRTPIGGYAEVLDDGRLRLRGLVARPDGSELHSGERIGPLPDAAALGHDLGAELRSRMEPGFFDE